MLKMFKNLFKESGVKNVITLFHAPHVQSSIRVHTMLKQAAATAQSHATEDQASSHGQQSKSERTEFNLDVTEEPPTPDQLNSILEYLGPGNAGLVVKDASSSGDALSKLKQNGSTFQRPVVVDWNNGRAVAGDNESEIMNLVRALSKKT
ncbi:hypothetical protein LTR28_010490 [Elasticomyces elasticus]|nr:hypothetical protein LTR28_010490 [Elasticomyces elasticus]